MEINFDVYCTWSSSYFLENACQNNGEQSRDICGVITTISDVCIESMP